MKVIFYKAFHQYQKNQIIFICIKFHQHRINLNFFIYKAENLLLSLFLLSLQQTFYYTTLKEMTKKSASTSNKDGIKPSQFTRQANKPPLINKIPTSNSSSSKGDNIPDAEKLRLIDQTGLMRKVKQRENELLVKQQASTSEYIWQAIFLSIPFGFLMATFDVTVKVQFSEPWDYAGIVTKCAKSAPGKLSWSNGLCCVVLCCVCVCILYVERERERETLL